MRWHAFSSSPNLLGLVEYEIGNVFDPAYTVVCKIKKDLLRQIGVMSLAPGL